MAKRDVAITSLSHAEDESPRPNLSDEGSEATPLRNELPTTNLLPEVTEELDEFNTAHEKALYDESGDQQVSSVQEEVPVAPNATTSTTQRRLNLHLPHSTLRHLNHSDLKIQIR